MPIQFSDPKPDAEFDGNHRFWWRYGWDSNKPFAAWLMMNPSWASPERSDKTVDRVLHFSREHGCGGAIVVNMWSLITPDSGAMWREVPTLPPEKIARNRASIERAGKEAGLRIVAFGVDAGRDHRAHVEDMVAAFGTGLSCLGTSSDGWPNHPLVRGKLYIPNDRQLIDWSMPTKKPA